MEGIVFLGLFAGCLARTLLPMLRKMKQAAERSEPFRFDSRYFVTFLVSVLTSAIFAMLAVPMLDWPTEGTVFAAFAFGWAGNDVINSMIS